MTDASRPDPDRLLARVQEEAVRAGRGRLKIFLGAAPGVGKTFAMLEAAHAAARAGRDVMVGVVETHGRSETARLLDGLDALPLRTTTHRGITLDEFDLDAALARRPGLLLVDELAHTNAPGSRHAKRWQDVRELCDAGLDVYATLNIQHIESLNDVVAQITGVVVRETIPDAVLDEASEIELVDVSPDVLQQRLREGKVYLPDQAGRALDRFFSRGNLMALRELALRRAAEQVDAAMLDWRAEAGIQGAWPAGERVLIAVAPTADAPRLVRSGWRLATALRAECLVVHIETAEVRALSPAARQPVEEALRLGEELGARALAVTGTDVGADLLAMIRRENVTRVVLGRSRRSGWWARLRPSPVDRLLAGYEGIDVHVVAPRRDRPASVRDADAAPGRGASWREYAGALAWVAGATALGLPLRELLSTTDVAMLFLLAVTIAGARSRTAPGIAAAVASIALFDIAFVPPYYTFAVSDARYLLTFAVMLGVAVAVSRIASRIREQADAARSRERRNAALLDLAHELALAGTASDIAVAVQRRIADSLGADVAMFSIGEAGDLVPLAASPIAIDDRERAVAQWAATRRDVAGRGTATLPAAEALWLPLALSDHAIGALGVRPPAHDAFDVPRRQFLDAVARQAAVALERLRLAMRSEHDRVEIESERLRTALLSSLSHDLRTPLAGVEGAATTLLRGGRALDDAVWRELLSTVVDESRRMGRLIANLLDMVRMESGALRVQSDWQSLEEVVGMALLRVDALLAPFEVATDVPADLPLVRGDGLLLEQVTVNLLENAAKYAPPGSRLEVSLRAVGREVELRVADRGPGVPPGEEERIFEKFHRAPGAMGGGVGLGLAICRGIVTAHGGTIRAEPREGGGLALVVRLPAPDEQPIVAPESVA